MDCCVVDFLNNIFYVFFAEPPCLAEIERIQIQEPSKRKPGKCTQTDKPAKMQSQENEGKDIIRNTLDGVQWIEDRRLF